MMAQSADPRLGTIRQDIERIDRQLVELMAERARLAREVGELKRASSLPTLDPRQEAAVVRRAVEMARESGLPGEAVREIFWRLIELCRTLQAEER